MASASTCTEVEQEAQCPICWEYLREPVTLDCGHNFCRKCISFYSEICEEIKDLECPLCSIQIRKEPFRSNWQLRNLIEAIKRLLNPRKEDVCAEHKKKLQLFCKEDEELVCSVCRCSREHRTHTVESHVARLSEELSSLDTPMKELEEKCQQVPSKLLQVSLVERGQVCGRSEFLCTSSSVSFYADCCHLEPLGGGSEGWPGAPSLGHPYKMQTLQTNLADKKAVLCPAPSVHNRICSNRLIFSPSTSMLQRIFKKIFLFSTESVILDQNTAHAKLILSNDKKSVWVADGPQVLPEKLSQFDHWQCVLGTKGFVSGRHFWEILVENQEKWSIGVAQGSVPRKGRFPLGPVEGIWAVGKWDRQYWALDCPGRLRLSPERDLKRIRVTLNYLGGRVAFFDADTEELLFAFSSAFPIANAFCGLSSSLPSVQVHPACVPPVHICREADGRSLAGMLTAPK
uniref:Uncharacterized protein n=1 Tax=Varanus komodoensis TaxID=61221 RepID=A0A8D2IWF8_VARKO